MKQTNALLLLRKNELTILVYRRGVKGQKLVQLVHSERRTNLKNANEIVKQLS